MRIRTHTVVGVAVAIVVAWASVGAIVYLALPDWEKRGQFGDVFGAVNALFSGLAFAGLIFAILLQREDLELQRQELALNRQELARTAQAQEQSEAALRAQAEAATKSSRLATINFLLDHYRRELAQMRGVAYLGNDPRLRKMRALEVREQALLSQLDLLFREVIPDEQPTDSTQDR
ncbi:hypothetical protein [Hydrogenophaga sp.]|uniref:hypothetical protein n=1 Tax=Hydrogenophaga sp. TaxID=1904254 RepID=UPI003F6E58F7